MNYLILNRFLKHLNQRNRIARFLIPSPNFYTLYLQCTAVITCGTVLKGCCYCCCRTYSALTNGTEKKKKRKQGSHSLETMAKRQRSSELLSQVCLCICMCVYISGCEMGVYVVVLCSPELTQTKFQTLTFVRILRNWAIIITSSLTGNKKAATTRVPHIGSLDICQVSEHLWCRISKIFQLLYCGFSHLWINSE